MTDTTTPLSTRGHRAALEAAEKQALSMVESALVKALREYEIETGRRVKEVTVFRDSVGSVGIGFRRR